MKNLQKTLVAAGIATAVFATGAAQAAVVTNPSTGLTYEKTVVSEAVLTTIEVFQAGPWTLTLGATETLSEDDSLVLTLTNGATWSAIASADLLTTGTAGDLSLVSLSTDKTKATFRVTNAAGIAGGVVISIANTALVAGTAVPKGGNVSMVAEMSGFVGGIATSLYGSPLTTNLIDTKPLYTAVVTTPQTGVVDVAKGFTELTAASSSSPAAPSPQVLSNVAVVSVTADASATAKSVTTTTPTTVPTAGKVLLTVAGNMTGVKSIQASNYTGTTAAGAATTPATAAGTMNMVVADNKAYATNTVAIAPGATTASNITVTFDGTTVLDPRSFTASVAGLADGTNFTAESVMGDSGLFSFTRNGSAFSSNSLGSLNKVTVTDRSGAIGTGGADGAIAITAYDASGALVACTGLTIPNVGANATVTIQGADITSSCPGAKRIEGVVNSSSIISTNTKITADGATSQSGLNGAATIAN